MNNISICPQSYTSTTPNIQSMSIEMYALELNKSATFKVVLHSSAQLSFFPGSIIQYVQIEGDEYNQWGNDDTYVIQKICEKLGVTLTT